MAQDPEIQSVEGTSYILSQNVTVAAIQKLAESLRSEGFKFEENGSIEHYKTNAPTAELGKLLMDQKVPIVSTASAPVDMRTGKQILPTFER